MATKTSTDTSTKTTQNGQESALLGYGFVLLAALSWGLLGPLSRFAFAEHADATEVAFWRAAIAAIFFIFHALYKREYWIAPKDALTFSLFGFLGVSLFFTAFMLAVREVGASVAAILLYSAPVWVTLYARFLFHEKISRIRIFSLAAAVCGTTLVCLAGGGIIAGGNVFLGILWGIISGFSYSTHFILGKKFLGRYSSVSIYAWCLPTGALGILPFVTFSPHSARVWIVMTLLAVLCTWFSYLCYCAGLKRLPVSRAAIVCNFEPVAAAVLAFWWWDERIAPLGLLGAALVIGAMFLVIFEKDNDNA